jgi:hypothetical protein
MNLLNPSRANFLGTPLLLLNTSHKMTLNAKISEAAWTVRDTRQLNMNRYVKVKQSHYRPGVAKRAPGS